ncbi:hypothetical protein FOPG_10023 [Fusarium oxysporum f. sp. conglutinans race 2 54008]|uniref:Uncharacterized protein n=2 Tax=Fusarium oxysporum TaxID=5507 RepID=X0HTE1_FUSOX|nr:hypothetical protein FOVG_10147 [Fusarium oxysporum f. sp. pisi HDV247]EXL74910.1 hypothetical protein FOPG_10023 [Fusarium oxysporum f. sp. conglutinans race 2 54008]
MRLSRTQDKHDSTAEMESQPQDRRPPLPVRYSSAGSPRPSFPDLIPVGIDFSTTPRVLHRETPIDASNSMRVGVRIREFSSIARTRKARPTHDPASRTNHFLALLDEVSGSITVVDCGSKRFDMGDLVEPEDE